MDSNFNVLVTSISKKVPLIKAIRHSLNQLNLSSQLIGGDTNFRCIAKYFVDEFWQMPLQNILNINDLLDYCKRHTIKAIIPTRDGELTFFSKHQEILSNHGISCMISPETAIKTCQNKLLFYQFFSQSQLPAILTTTDIKAIQKSSYVVKECFGAGSFGIGLDLSIIQAKAWAENLIHPIYQPFIQGKEYSIDVYISRQGTPHGAIARVRELIIDGESQITYSVHSPEMEALCLKAALELGIYGHAVFQVLCDSSHHLHMIECNARFGGASTLSIAMGLDSFTWFFQESLGKSLSPFTRSSQEMRQIRFAEDKIQIL